MAAATIPSGVSPQRSKMRFDSDPWLTPMRSATPRVRHCSMSASSSPCSLR